MVTVCARIQGQPGFNELAKLGVRYFRRIHPEAANTHTAERRFVESRIFIIAAYRHREGHAY
jgi:hypothetical protein